MKPGATEVMVTPFDPTSLAQRLGEATTPALAAP